MLYRKWYILETGKKIVPKDLRLTPTILLHWFIGDGSVMRYGVKGTGIALFTLNFSKEDVQFLAERLELDLKIPFKIRKVLKKSNTLITYWILVIYSKDNINKFYSVINQADQDSLKYAKQNFPWKFANILSKKMVLLQRKSSDKLVELYLRHKQL